MSVRRKQSSRGDKVVQADGGGKLLSKGDFEEIKAAEGDEIVQVSD